MSARLRHLAGNLGAMVLALLLASVVWIAATLQDDPFTTATVADVPLTAVAQPPDTVLLQPLAERVTVQVRGPQSELRGLSASDLSATVNLEDVGLGKRTTVQIQVKTDNDILRVEAVTPSQQTVFLEALQTITMPVRIATRGDVAIGYQLGKLAITPSEVTLSGPPSILAQVSAVSGTLAVAHARETISVEVDVAPLDVNGAKVADVKWQPQKVQVQAPVRRKLGFKPDVTVIPELRGDPASGYRRGGVTVEPSSVTLAGLPSVLDSLPGFIRTQPISITGATEALTVRTTLDVPQNVVVVDAQFVTVTLDVVPIESSRIVTAVIEVQGLSPGLTATLSPNFVQVILVGPDPVLAGLKPGDVRVVANLLDYPLGSHRITPLVLPPEGVTVVSLIPETVEVVIDVAPTSVPTPLPAPSPTPKP